METSQGAVEFVSRIPDELLARILFNLAGGPPGTLSCQQVCRRFCRVVKQPSHWSTLDFTSLDTSLARDSLSFFSQPSYAPLLTHVTVLDLSHLDIDDAKASLLLSAARKSLVTARMRDCTTLSDVTLRTAGTCSKLRELDLRGCRNISAMQVLSMCTSSGALWPQLESLLLVGTRGLSGCTELTQEPGKSSVQALMGDLWTKLKQVRPKLQATSPTHLSM